MASKDARPKIDDVFIELMGRLDAGLEIASSVWRRSPNHQPGCTFSRHRWRRHFIAQSEVLPEGIDGFVTVAIVEIGQGTLAILIKVNRHLGGWIDLNWVSNPTLKVTSPQALTALSEIE